MEHTPLFHRGQVAKILGCVTRTISNREQSGIYPEPRRSANGYRIYTIDDVLGLQILTHNMIDTRPIAAALYDMGWHDRRRIIRLIEESVKKMTGE